MNTNRKGCVKGLLIGCGSIVILSFVLFILVMFFSTNFSFDTSDTIKSDGNFSIKDSLITSGELVSTKYSWQFVDEFLKTKKVSLSLDILKKDVNDALNYLDIIGKMSYKELGMKNNHQYNDPLLENKEVWEQIYIKIYNQGLLHIEKVSTGFQKIFASENLSPKNRILFLIAFVQNIEYKRPGGVLDLLPPIASLAKKYGDCDTKSLLLYILLEKMKVDCVLFWSYNYKHAMLGVALNGSGNYKTYNGKKYYFLETTYPDWGIGQISPEADNLKYWYITDLDLKTEKEKYFQNTDTQQNDTRNKRQRWDKKPSPAQH